MASEIAMNATKRIVNLGGFESIALAVDAAIREASKPLVEAVEEYADWCDGDNPSSLEAKRVYDTMIDAARKLKKVK